MPMPIEPRVGNDVWPIQPLARAVAVETEPTFQRGQTVRLFGTAEYGVSSGNRRIDISPDGRFLMFKADPATEAPRPVLVQN